MGRIGVRRNRSGSKLSPTARLTACPESTSGHSSSFRRPSRTVRGARSCSAVVSAARPYRFSSVAPVMDGRRTTRTPAPTGRQRRWRPTPLFGTRPSSRSAMAGRTSRSVRNSYPSSCVGCTGSTRVHGRHPRALRSRRWSSGPTSSRSPSPRRSGDCPPDLDRRARCGVIPDAARCPRSNRSLWVARGAATKLLCHPSILWCH